MYFFETVSLFLRNTLFLNIFSIIEVCWVVITYKTRKRKWKSNYLSLCLCMYTNIYNVICVQWFFFCLKFNNSLYYRYNTFILSADALKLVEHSHSLVTLFLLFFGETSIVLCSKNDGTVRIWRTELVFKL